MSEWKKVTGELGQMVRWTEEPANEKAREKTVYVGPVVEGVYERRQDGVGMNAATIYNIRTKEHGLLAVWDTTVLNGKMSEVPVGSEVQITCLGYQEAKKGGKGYTGFEVQYREAPMKVAGQSVAEGDEADDATPEGDGLPPV